MRAGPPRIDVEYTPGSMGVLRTWSTWSAECCPLRVGRRRLGPKYCSTKVGFVENSPAFYAAASHCRQRRAPRHCRAQRQAPLQGGIAPLSSPGRKQQPRAASTHGRAWSLGRWALWGPFRHATAADRSLQEVAADQVTEGARLGRRYEGRRGAGAFAVFFSALSEKLEAHRCHCQNPPICQALASLPPLFLLPPPLYGAMGAARARGGVACRCRSRRPVPRSHRSVPDRATKLRQRVCAIPTGGEGCNHSLPWPQNRLALRAACRLHGVAR